MGPSHIINIKKEKRETDEETKQILRMLEKDDVGTTRPGGMGFWGAGPGGKKSPLISWKPVNSRNLQLEKTEGGCGPGMCAC